MGISNLKTSQLTNREEFLKIADQNLYKAKDEERNCIAFTDSKTGETIYSRNNIKWKEKSKIIPFPTHKTKPNNPPQEQN